MRAQRFVQATAQKTTKVPFWALEQKLGRSSKTKGAQLANIFRTCRKFCTIERPEKTKSPNLGA
jgi:hypothetical protein